LINQTAILIFANSAQKEVERKSFLSMDVFSALNSQIIKTVKKTRLPYFHFSEEEQIGDNFGERFSNAIESIFDKGFTNVITIGNDTPHLKASHLLETSKKLQKNDLVLGPSKNGGFYLMGIKKSHFNKETFLKLPWQTAKLHKSISKITSSKKLIVSFLEILKDINIKEDIKAILNSFRAISISLLHLLQQLIFTTKTISTPVKIDISKISFSQNFNKGSPFIFVQ